MLGAGIVAFIIAAAGQLVWRIYSEGTGFHNRVPAVMPSCLNLPLWLIGFEATLQGSLEQGG